MTKPIDEGGSHNSRADIDEEESLLKPKKPLGKGLVLRAAIGGLVMQLAIGCLQFGTVFLKPDHHRKGHLDVQCLQHTTPLSCLAMRS